jgi:hypothetical protein
VSFSGLFVMKVVHHILAGMLSSLLDASGKKTLLEAIEISETSLGKETAISHEQCK